MLVKLRPHKDLIKPSSYRRRQQYIPNTKENIKNIRYKKRWSIDKPTHGGPTIRQVWIINSRQPSPTHQKHAFLSHSVSSIRITHSLHPSHNHIYNRGSTHIKWGTKLRKHCNRKKARLRQFARLSSTSHTLLVCYHSSPHNVTSRNTPFCCKPIVSWANFGLRRHLSLSLSLSLIVITLP